jgi:hypothetical protein
MTMKHITLPLAIAAAAALVFSTASVATAVTPPTGTLVVKLVDLAGHTITKQPAKTRVLAYSSGNFSEVVPMHHGVGKLSIPSGSAYQLTVTGTKPFVESYQKEPAMPPGGKQSLTVKLARGATIEGTLENSKGKPIKHSLIELGTDGVDAGRTTTDSRGHYSFTGLSTNKFVLLFNRVDFVDGGKAPTTAPASSFAYLGNAKSFPAAKYQKVYEQSSHRKPTVLKEKTLKIKASGLIIARLTSTEKGVLNGWTGAWTTRPGDDEEDTAIGGVDKAGTGFSLRPLAGSYDVWALDGTTMYFYTGNGNLLSTDQSDAVPVKIGTKDVHITFGDIPHV